MRTYIVGLPVAVAVDDDGKVSVAVDTAEAASALWEDSGVEGEVRDDEQVRLDYERVSQAHELGTITAGLMWTPVVHRYADCADMKPGDVVHDTDEDGRPVTCTACRRDLGLGD